jgi:hypothetical protein
MSDVKFLIEIATDRKLARLGDAYINFIFSLALSKVEGEPQGIKVSNNILAEACKRSGLRRLLPKRTQKAEMANAVEAIIAQAYLSNSVGIEESQHLVITAIPDQVRAAQELLSLALKRLGYGSGKSAIG